MQKTEPTWSGQRVIDEAEELFNQFVEDYEGKDPAEITLALLREICCLKATNYQLVEHLAINWDKSNGAFKNSHALVQKWQEIEAIVKSQGRNYSERLERLESRKRG